MPSQSKMKLLFATLLLSSLLLSSSFLETAMAYEESCKIFSYCYILSKYTYFLKLSMMCVLMVAYCSSKCSDRCSAAGVKDRCLKYCGICCSECKCVPSGTYGNKHECPCYRDKLNKKGKPKCP